MIFCHLWLQWLKGEVNYFHDLTCEIFFPWYGNINQFSISLKAWRSRSNCFEKNTPQRSVLSAHFYGLSAFPIKSITATKGNHPANINIPVSTNLYFLFFFFGAHFISRIYTQFQFGVASRRAAAILYSAASITTTYIYTHDVSPNKLFFLSVHDEFNNISFTYLICDNTSQSCHIYSRICLYVLYASTCSNMCDITHSWDIRRKNITTIKWCRVYAIWKTIPTRRQLAKEYAFKVLLPHEI